MQAHCDVEWLDDILHMTTCTAFASEPIDCIRTSSSYRHKHTTTFGRIDGLPQMTPASSVPMQAHCDVEWLEDGLHMATGTAFASEPIDYTCNWELEPDPELAWPDVRSSNNLRASKKLAQAELCARADKDAWQPLYHATGAHIEQTDLGQRRVTSRPTTDTPPPSFNENVSEAPDTPPHPNAPPVRGCTTSLGRVALTSAKRPTVCRKHSAPLLRKQWAPDEEALFLKALAAFAKEIETTSDPATGRVSVHLDRGVAEMMSMIVATRSVAQVRSHVQKHYIRKAREAARAAAATTS